MQFPEGPRDRLARAAAGRAASPASFAVPSFASVAADAEDDDPSASVIELNPKAVEDVDDVVTSGGRAPCGSDRSCSS